MQRDSYKLYQLKRALKHLEKKKGYHTTLISLFIPPDRELSQVRAYLKNEIAESQNIKSKLTRKNVLESITTLIQRLNTIRELPPTGLVILSGAIPQGNSPGTERNEIYVIEPPEPVPFFKYHCAGEFLLEPLKEMLKEKLVYGLVVVGRKEAAIAYLRGTHLEIVQTLTSGVHGKHRAGGQSQRRFERLVEEGERKFYQRVAEHANSLFLNLEGLEGIYIGGPGQSKEKFNEMGLLDYRLKVIDLVDTDYSGEEGIRSLLYRIEDRLKDVQYIKEKRVVQRFITHVAKDDGLGVYGEKETRQYLEMGALKVLLLSEKLDLVRVVVSCEACKYNKETTVHEDDEDTFVEETSSQKCPNCSSSLLRVVESRSIIEDLGDLARELGTRVLVVSTETEEGETLWSTFGGVAGILRYKP
ncbi:MAG: peptide chain release factor aRF-1 [Promethearchaeota archaeon]